jgi:hypothetical protein
MSELIPIRPQHVAPHIKLLGLRTSQKLAAPTSGRRVNRSTRSVGWYTQAVDKDGNQASPASEGVAVHAQYYSGRGYMPENDKIEKEQQQLTDQLISHGFTVKPHKFSGIIVSKEA